MPTKSELLMESKTKVTLEIGTLFKIFNAGFDYGVNEGACPQEKGTFHAFHDLIEGKVYDGAGTSYPGLAHQITIAE